MKTYRENPDSEENQSASKQNRREAFALKMMAKEPTPLTDANSDDDLVDADFARRLETLARKLAADLRLEQNPKSSCNSLREWEAFMDAESGRTIPELMP